MKRVAVFFGALLSGCASVPSGAPPYARAPEPPSGNTNVYIYRLGAYPTLRTPSIVVDGKKVFDPPEKAYTVITLEPGAHKFVVNWSWDTGWPDLEFPFEVRSGTPLYIKISGSFDYKGSDYRGRIYEAGSLAHAVSMSQAEAELTVCCRYIPPSR